MEKFRELGISESIISMLSKKGFEEPTPIQKLCIPVLLKEKDVDVIGQAQTGTGKTAAFSIPILESIETIKNKKVKALILAPTRELTIQISDEINSMKASKSASIFPIYGGASIVRQISHLRKGVDIVVGTPGRIMDLINRKILILDSLTHFILDEADEMLNMGFIEDIDEILSHTNADKRMLFFSATIPNQILKIADKYMKNKKILKVKSNELTTDLTEQIYFEVAARDKFELLTRTIDMEIDFYALIFCRTKNDVDEVKDKLISRGYDVDGIHGDIAQRQRELVLKRFKNKQINILVATDVAARGIDVSDLTHVINYSIPQDPESYTHRIGRTGRAGKEGTAITFVTSSEYRKLAFIKNVTKTTIKKEKIPSIKEIISIKKNKIKQEILSKDVANINVDYIEIAKEICEKTSAFEALASTLNYAFPDVLNVENYGKISEPSNRRRDSKILDSHTRLFISKGKKDDMDISELKKFVRSKIKLRDNEMKNIVVCENFSFISIPFDKAEQLIYMFAKDKKHGKPMVEKAKVRK